MNDELQSVLIEMLNKGAHAIEEAGSLVAAEVPDVVAQLLAWKAIESAMLCAFGVAMLFASYWILRRGVRIKKELYDSAILAFSNKESWAYYHGNFNSNIPSLKFNDHTSMVPFAVMGVFGCALMVAITGLCLLRFDWLQIWIAPKVYLIEYAASLTK